MDYQVLFSIIGLFIGIFIYFAVLCVFLFFFGEELFASIFIGRV